MLGKIFAEHIVLPSNPAVIRNLQRGKLCQCDTLFVWTGCISEYLWRTVVQPLPSNQV